MPFILHIESATKVCSVALSNDGALVACRETDATAYSHSGLLTLFVQEVMQQAGIAMHDLSAISVSSGPGSYTGLRIGVSAAKGLCYGLEIPLIAVDTMTAMATHCRDVLSTRSVVPPEALEAIYCPMIDARRMEVYFALFDHTINPIQETRADIIAKDSFSDILDGHKLLLFGDGAHKCKHILTRRNAIFLDDIFPSAKGMILSASQKFIRSEFVDVAYFEPYYLKNFVAGTPHVKGLHKNF